MRSMATVRPLGDVRVAWAGRAPHAMNASATQDASMEHAASHGSVTVRRDGAASSATRTSTTAPITNPVQTEPPAPTPDRVATPAPVGPALEEPTVS